MKLLDKIKNAIFEEDEIEETEVKESEVEDLKIPFKEEVVKKIDIEKTIPKKIELPVEEEVVEEPKVTLPKREHRVTPMIFNEEDFLMEEELAPVPPKKEVVKEEPRKPLYAGYKDDKQKEKFKPSPIISPVYGFVGVSPVLEQPRNEDLSSFNEMFAKEKKDTITLESVRRKAYGETAPASKQEVEDDDLGLLYDMKQEDKPAISKITLGDAEEYFDDLGLEYNVDYKDSAREKQQPKKEEKVVETKEKNLESTEDLEITKEQLKPKTAKEIKKVTKIKDLEVPDDVPEIEEADEKNLYDLIDMMYESKE